MRKYAIVPALVAVIAAVWVWTASAVDGPRTLTLIEVSIPKNDRALGDFSFERPPASGDRFVVTNALTSEGKRVGQVKVFHTFVTGFGSRFDRKATVLFVAQAYVPGGSLLAEGYGQVSADGPTKLSIPVLGGTGSYANVRGELKVRTLSQNKTRLEFRLMP